MLCYFSFGGVFFALLPPSPEIPKNEKKSCKYHYFTKVYQKSESHAMGSWHMGYNGFNYFSFWALFCAFPLLTNQKMKISKNWKKKKKETHGWTDGESDRGTRQTNHTVTPIAKIFLWRKVQFRKFKTLSRIYQICSLSCNSN